MKSTIAALVSAAVITPAVADAALPGPDKSPPAQVQAKKDVKAAKATTARERAKVAKAKKKSPRKQDKTVAPKAS